MSLETQRFEVGSASITAVVEDQSDQLSPELLFPAATAAQVARHDWLIPDYADAIGNISMRVQAFVVEVAGRRLLVDPCVGNHKVRFLPMWNEKSWPFLDRFAEAGFTPDTIDTVVHTHLHADHVGWDTHRADGQWVPTFTRARHLYTQAELDYWPAHQFPGEDVFADSVQPIINAGLADVVDADADLGDGLRLEPTPGHTPGQVALWIDSDNELALISGDFIHHPAQFAEPHWAEIADADEDTARETRRRMIERLAESRALVLGTHFPTRPAGRVLSNGDGWRFDPV